ncbi:Sjogren's syndrome/scleroderma autoantigen 1 family protein [Methanoplanus endosymbiosus]|uniref:Sjogrens syndrome scleroderma autoantigen 1 n=1 Tax=Methanoplanus endosymbiosus TaxID=33865 RepID=A0A9E7PMW7_9EURY|nr:Sjogren's syndrome/scleroderma autoantigen 1 family protein [Methanoplanus endosymbiosus]UUX91884.1 hypothetical protein L6E24_11005 [Methanoplanus endosymbiosus]
MRKPEDIMADYLLKGGKMLEKTCSVCGSPLFIVKGETLCVVCAENPPVAAEPPVVHESAKKSEIANNDSEYSNGCISAPDASSYVRNSVRSSAGNMAENIPEVKDFHPDSLYLDIEDTIKDLCERIRDTANPGDCLTYMRCIKTGTGALNELKKR